MAEKRLIIRPEDVQNDNETDIATVRPEFACAYISSVNSEEKVHCIGHGKEIREGENFKIVIDQTGDVSRSEATPTSSEKVQTKVMVTKDDKQAFAQGEHTVAEAGKDHVYSKASGEKCAVALRTASGQQAMCMVSGANSGIEISIGKKPSLRKQKSKPNANSATKHVVTDDQINKTVEESNTDNADSFHTSEKIEGQSEKNEVKQKKSNVISRLFSCVSSRNHKNNDQKMKNSNKSGINK